jgi:hypothetical protein
MEYAIEGLFRNDLFLAIQFQNIQVGFKEMFCVK